MRDCLVGTTTGSWGATASLALIDSVQADLTLSGEQLYQRAIVRVLGASGAIQDARIATFNVGSGAFQTLVAAATTIAAGTPYEVHTLLSPVEKDQCLDQVIDHLRMRYEVPLDTQRDAVIYSLGPEILDVHDVRFFGYPVASHNEGKVSWWRLMATATGQELRIHPALDQSQQLVLDAIISMSLGAADTATINIPDDHWALVGAAAHGYWLLEARAPAQETARYRERRREMANEFTGLSGRFQPKIVRKTQLDDFWKGEFSPRDIVSKA